MASHRHRSHRRTAQSGHGWPTTVTVLSAAAGAAVALVPTSPAGAAPGDDPDRASRASVSSRIDRLYEQAEAATEKFNGAAERTSRLREQVEHAQDAMARGQARVNKLRDALGEVAGAQYRSGGIDPALALILSSDPDSYLDKAATLDRIGNRQRGELTALRTAQRDLAQRRTEAGGRLTDLERQQRRLKAAKRTVQQKLAEARRLLSRMSAEDRAAHERASRGGGQGKKGSAADVPGNGKLPAPSGRAADAVAAARSAVGSPYVWGAAGPGSFDCSGLTQWAYAQAGTSIPRTSQGQRTAGRQVPLSEARPGDLVTYRDDASHVGMYVGGGQVVHAPHPGASVRYDPVGMMPVSAVTRP